MSRKRYVDEVTTKRTYDLVDSEGNVVMSDIEMVRSDTPSVVGDKFMAPDANQISDLVDYIPTETDATITSQLNVPTFTENRRIPIQVLTLIEGDQISIKRNNDTPLNLYKDFEGTKPVKKLKPGTYEIYNMDTKYYLVPGGGVMGELLRTDEDTLVANKLVGIFNNKVITTKESITELETGSSPTGLTSFRASSGRIISFSNNGGNMYYSIYSDDSSATVIKSRTLFLNNHSGEMTVETDTQDEYLFVGRSGVNSLPNAVLITLNSDNTVSTTTPVALDSTAISFSRSLNRVDVDKFIFTSNQGTIAFSIKPTITTGNRVYVGGNSVSCAFNNSELMISAAISNQMRVYYATLNGLTITNTGTYLPLETTNTSYNFDSYNPLNIGVNAIMYPYAIYNVSQGTTSVAALSMRRLTISNGTISSTTVDGITGNPYPMPAIPIKKMFGSTDLIYTTNTFIRVSDSSGNTTNMLAYPETFRSWSPIDLSDGFLAIIATNTTSANNIFEERLIQVGNVIDFDTKVIFTHHTMTDSDIDFDGLRKVLVGEI